MRLFSCILYICYVSHNMEFDQGGCLPFMNFLQWFLICLPWNHSVAIGATCQKTYGFPMALQLSPVYIRGCQANITQGVDVGHGQRMPGMHVFASVFKDFRKPSRFAFHSWPRFLYAQVPMNSSAETQRFQMVYDQFFLGRPLLHSKKCSFSQWFSKGFGKPSWSCFFGQAVLLYLCGIPVWMREIQGFPWF